jgi:hypothetical protein
MMNWIKRNPMSGCVLLALICLSLAGCGTPQIAIAPDAHLDSYKKVYLVPARVDSRNVTPRMLGRLRETGFEAIEISTNSPVLAGQGSGFIISPEGHVLTCAHVIENQTNATIWVEGRRHPCTVLACNTNADLALLKVDDDHVPFRPLQFAAGTNYAMGEDVFTMGFPLVGVLGTEPRLNKGLISATVGLADNPKFVQISAAVQPGNSGGPLLNAHGETIGMVAATLNPFRVALQTGGALPQNVNFAIKGNIIREFLMTNHVALPLAGSNDEGFEGAKKSLALVRPGNVTEEELKEPALVCFFGYNSAHGYSWRFRAIEIDFYDAKTGNAVFKTRQLKDDPFASENSQLDQLFVYIYATFFPHRHNPFIK